MMKRTEHLYAGFREHATYHFLLRTTGMIELNNRLGHQKTLGLNGRQHEFYKFRNWIVVSRYRNLTCELTLRYNIAWTRTLPVPAQYERAASQLPPGFLEINFQAGMIDLESRIDGGPEWTAENVSSLEITPNQKITVVSDLSQTFRPVSEPYQTGDRQASCSPRAMSETAQGLLFRIFQPNDRQEESGNGFRIMPQSAPQPETPSSPDAAEQRQSAQVQQEWKTAQTERNHAPEDFARIRDTLNQVQQELEQTRDERNQARKDLAQMREQFEREQRRNAQLQTSLSGSLERLAERLRPDLEHLNAALQEKTRAVETRTAE